MQKPRHDVVIKFSLVFIGFASKFNFQRQAPWSRNKSFYKFLSDWYQGASQAFHNKVGPLYSPSISVSTSTPVSPVISLWAGRLPSIRPHCVFCVNKSPIILPFLWPVVTSRFILAQYASKQSAPNSTASLKSVYSSTQPARYFFGKFQAEQISETEWPSLQCVT